MTEKPQFDSVKVHFASSKLEKTLYYIIELISLHFALNPNIL